MNLQCGEIFYNSILHIFHKPPLSIDLQYSLSQQNNNTMTIMSVELRKHFRRTSNVISHSLIICFTLYNGRRYPEKQILYLTKKYSLQKIN